MRGARLPVVGARILLVGMAALASCDIRVPVVDVNAAFALADVSWFAGEQTLFVFYRVDAAQGLGPQSQLEIAFRTDEADQDFIRLQDLSPVHTHVEVDCGFRSRCGSWSTRVRLPPRDVRLRLRYHKDGLVTLSAEVALNLQSEGPAHSNRSLVVYGVFDEGNTRVQWRARHQFPTIRNEDAQALGLRRAFAIDGARHGALAIADDNNPYAYGSQVACPSDLIVLGWPVFQTSDRAAFAQVPLPLSASTSNAVCALSTVTDATGPFEAIAIARKNPQAPPAFPLLRSPITENLVLGSLMTICDRDISQVHLDVQRQRLFLEAAPVICMDAFADPGFADVLAAQLQERIDESRATGSDMVLVIALHHDDTSGALARVLEDALSQVLPSESDRASPRLSGAFVFDSFAHAIRQADVRRLALWCPANLPFDDLDQIEDQSDRSCALLPDPIDLPLGPIRISTSSLPILPTRPQLLTFIDKYSLAQAGRMLSMRFLAPERTTTSENVDLGEFGFATFFNQEVLTASPTDAFSHCTEGGETPVVFRSEGQPEPIPLFDLPAFHEAAGESSYGLGLVWPFPYLLHIEYETQLPGAVDAVGFSLPFGVASQVEELQGAQLWQKETFPLDEELLQCTRFCDHPTFDSAGIYNIRDRFDVVYQNQCYRPRFPAPADGGFPRDP